MEFVAALDAATHLPQLLERVARGEQFTITEHGKPITRLIPATAIKPAPDLQAAVEAMKRFRKGRSLDNQSIREMIEDGRRSWGVMTTSMTGSFVLDGSVALARELNEDDDYATAILDEMPMLQAHVPSLWPLEVVNVLLVSEQRGRTSAADAARFLAILGTFRIKVDDETVARAWVETIHLARSRQLP